MTRPMGVGLTLTTTLPSTSGVTLIMVLPMGVGLINDSAKHIRAHSDHDPATMDLL